MSEFGKIITLKAMHTTIGLMVNAADIIVMIQTVLDDKDETKSEHDKMLGLVQVLREMEAADRGGDEGEVAEA